MEQLANLFSSVIGLLVLLGIPFFVYNLVVSKKNAVDSAFAGMDVYLKQRFDLIPNLVSAVQTYMKHEREVLTQLTELRAKALSGTSTVDEHIALDRDISRALGGLRVAAEAYPDLKSSANFLHLQSALGEVEANIAAARRNYNGTVMSFNNTIEMFPTNIAARMMSLTRRGMFEIPPEERQNVNVRQLFQR